MGQFFVTIGMRDARGTILNLVELGQSETGYAIIDYEREQAYQNAWPNETIQQKVEKELAFNEPSNIMRMVDEAVSRMK